MATKPLKQRVIEELDQLPEDRLREVLDFVGHLKRKAERETPPPRELDPEKDPILKLIGSVSHGALAKDIDEELYGA